jgi:hypothetical protein
MSDKIGVLGSAAVLTAATTPIYTVPTGKAAKGRIFYRVVGNSDASTDITITVNDVIVMTHSNITASNILFSSPNAIKEGPLATTAQTGVDGDTTGAPAPIEYFLSAADIVSYTLAGSAALAGTSFQFVGTEIDV